MTRNLTIALLGLCILWQGCQENENGDPIDSDTDPIDNDTDPIDSDTDPTDSDTDPIDSDETLGPCTGTPAECEAARVINEYRTTHFNPGECNNALKWNDDMGRLAHDHQSGPFVRHSGYSYLENVGMAFGLRETAEYIIQYESGTEPHCNADGSYQMSHHCAAMYCGNFTIGVGVFEQNGATYMTMMFGDENGQP